MTKVQNHKKNLDTLYRAAKDKALALVECRRITDGEVVAMLCCIGFNNGEYTITPFAEMVNGNPFELYQPPDPDGGFFSEKGE